MADCEKGSWKVLASEYLIRKPWLTARVDILIKVAAIKCAG